MDNYELVLEYEIDGEKAKYRCSYYHCPTMGNIHRAMRAIRDMPQYTNNKLRFTRYEVIEYYQESEIVMSDDINIELYI